MPKVRLLAPYTDSDGEQHAAGAVIDVSGEEAADLNNAGKASLLSEEAKAAKTAEEQAQTPAERIERSSSTEATEEPPKKK